MAKNKTLEALVSIAGSVDPSLSKSMAKATKQFSGLKIGIAAVATFAAVATGALVKFGVDAVKAAAEFESQTANIATLLDGDAAAVRDRISQIGDDILSLSNSTGTATAELADGMYQIISAVGDSEDAIKQTEVAARAAKAGNAETTDAINLLTAVTKGYNDTSGEAFEKASDLAFVALKLGQTSFPELASSIGKVIPLASSLGVEQEELFASFAALTGVTGSTAEVATQMKAVMSGLLKPSKDMSTALESMGYISTNAALEALGLQGTLDALGSTVNGDTQALAKMFSSVEAQTAILSLAGAQSEDFTSKTAAMYEAAGATQQAFDAQTDTLEYTITCIKNLGTNFKTSIGRKILPVVKEVAEAVLPAIEEGLNKLSPIIDRIYEGLSPVLNVAGELIKGILPLFESRLSGMSEGWREMQPYISNLAEKLLPIIQTVIGKIVEITAVLQPIISEFISNLLPVIMTCIDACIPILDTLFTAASPILDMVAQLVTALLPALTAVMQVLQPLFVATAEQIKTLLGGAFEFLMPIIQNVVNMLSGLLDFITNVFSGNWEGAWESVKDIFANAVQAFEGIMKAPINAIILMINTLIAGINSMGISIPDWVPVLGGKEFKIDIPEIPMLYTGGFTQGPSIAGERGTEAVISFDPAYRSQNIDYWLKAGQLLGQKTSGLGNVLKSGIAGIMDSDSALSKGIEAIIHIDDTNLFEGFKKAAGDTIQLIFAPNITINGDSKKEDIIEAIREVEPEFTDMLEEFKERKGGGDYEFA